MALWRECPKAYVRAWQGERLALQAKGDFKRLGA